MGSRERARAQGWCGRLGAALALVFALGVAPASAQESDGSKRLLREALTEFNAGRWDEAYALFKRLHQAEPSARTLRGMGLSAFEARRYALAITDLRAALGETRRPLDDAQRVEVRRVIDQASGFVARCAVRLDPASARLAVDGREPLFESEAVLLLDPGTHEVVASAAGHGTQTRTLNVRGGDRMELAFELRPAANAVRGPAQPDDSAPVQDEPGVNAGGSLVGGYVAAGVALAFAGAAIGLHFAARGAASDVERACSGNCTPDRADAEIHESGVELYQTLSFVGWGLAAASAATSAVLFVLAADADGGEGVALRIAPTGVAVRGTF